MVSDTFRIPETNYAKHLESRVLRLKLVAFTPDPFSAPLMVQLT
jgi:hypothetical protein